MRVINEANLQEIKNSRVPNMIFSDKYVLFSLKNEKFWRKLCQNWIVKTEVILMNEQYDVTKWTNHELYMADYTHLLNNT